MSDFAKNTILYGPPGTGKTYNTVVCAVAIIEDKTIGEVESEDYSEVLERYNNYKANKRVEFVTFHQSYGYEEFIEGIKPVVKDGGIFYETVPGAFKKFCFPEETAEAESEASADEDNAHDIDADEDRAAENRVPNVWRVSIKFAPDNSDINYRNDYIERSLIKVSNYDDKEIFNNQMEIGDIVLANIDNVAYGISVITTAARGASHREREVRHLNVFDGGHPVRFDTAENWRESRGFFVSRLDPNDPGIKRTLEAVRNEPEYALLYPGEAAAESPDEGNKVFIIDEINRGNISKIFGELITLIEDSKRIGAPEECTASLPYSGEEFGVPENVYIIGTMNTADRSIAMLDTALRRRFEFREMLPAPELLSGVFVGDIDVKQMLEMINERVAALYDPEHTIGHAYFMPLKNSPDIGELARIFENKVIPLLQEYFYEDHEKIRLVLGDNTAEDESLQFITEEKLFADKLFGSGTKVRVNNARYRINRSAFKNENAYIKIYGGAREQ